MDLTKHIRTIPDWPKKGILFYDIMPLLADKDAFAASIAAIADRYKGKKIDYVVAVDARGFILGSAVAYKLNAGFVPIRKKGKLPFKTESVTYDLEYGNGTLEIQIDAIKKDSNVLMVDDLLATGGTMAAACELIEKQHGKIQAIAFLMELRELAGRKKIEKYNISSELVY
ncbi:MAG: adenine phosphoribosyltransferase [Planctomycetes bacterium GWF2_41_51]|nr:MAG: adenine phosphoribosyltransferase [Planctomycetes bacterium GWF2_41_51]HBG27860.1 adenine phosphoribosyltransferase [Phycisphaerales bacterium]